MILENQDAGLFLRGRSASFLCPILLPASYFIIYERDYFITLKIYYSKLVAFLQAYMGRFPDH